MTDDLVARFCAPTLAGLKTGSMFSCNYGSQEEMKQDMREMNLWLREKGLRVLPLRYQGGKALVYLYRPHWLAGDLANPDAARLLADRGYPTGCSDRCVAALVRRLKSDGGFPHEIGLFLGYPPEDVDGFIRNGAERCKCVGCWKVYGDEEKARRTFQKYHCCTADYCARVQRGAPVRQLAVNV